MIKQNKFKIFISFLVTLLPMVFGFILWERLPERLVTSFGFNGEAEGYSSKMFAVAGFPLIMAFLNLICIIAANADPSKKNINSKVFSVIISIVPACSLISGGCIYADALEYKLYIEKLIPAFIGIIILVLGFILPECKQNYTIGIKLPWTLHDEENWERTHKLSGKLWIIGGVLMIFSGLFGYTSLFMIILSCIVFIPVVYSYMIYKNGKQD